MRKLLLLIISICSFAMLQAQVTKTLELTTAGILNTVLTSTELSTVTDLTLTGSIDARDFKTMRDSMPVLANIDLSGATIMAYYGINGTYKYSSTNSYIANEMPHSAFEGNKVMKSVILPNTIVSLSFSVFESTKITSIEIPSLVTSIATGAFRGCSYLQSIKLSSSLQKIGTQIFSGCTELDTIIIPASLSQIGDRVFEYDSTYIIVDKSNSSFSSINGYLFDKNQTNLIYVPCSIKGDYTIPSSVTKISQQVFWQCKNLKSVTLPPNLTNIGANAFGGCIGLTAIVLPETVDTIGAGAFQTCEKLTSFTIPPKVTNLNSWTFANCTGLTSISIPATITTLGGNDFYRCLNLQSIYAYQSTPIDITKSSGVFQSDPFTTCTLYVPAGSKALYQAANQWQDFTNIVEMAPKSSLDSGLVAYYPFNGDANDKSGNGNDGTVYGATLTTDRFGITNHSYWFDGMSNYINCGNNPSFDLTPSNLTISVWVKNCKQFTPSGSKMMDLRSIIGRRDDQTNNGYGLAYGYWLGDGVPQTGNRIDLAFYGGYQGTAEIKIDTSVWTHIVGVFRSNKSTIYINGDSISTTNIFNGFQNALMSDFMIGRQGNYSSEFNYHFGSIDDIRIYNRPLTQTEIDSLYHQGGWPLTTPPVTTTTKSVLLFSAKPTAGTYFTIYKMKSDGSLLSPLFNDSYHRTGPTPTKDGMSMYYIKRKVAPENEGDSTWICKSDIAGKNEQIVYTYPDFVNFGFRSSLELSPDNTKLLFATMNGPNRDGDIFILDLNTKQTQNLTNDNDFVEGHFIFSTNGDSIIYTKNGTGWYADPFPLYKMKKDGSGNTPFLISGQGHYDSPQLSHNGKTIVYSYTSAVYTTHKLYIANSDGSNSRLFNFSTGINDVIAHESFSPDDSKIVCIRNNNEIVITDTTGLISKSIDVSSLAFDGSKMVWYNESANSLDSGLVAYYPFNGNANDESGNQNNGTVNGATLTADRFGNIGKAYSFDGANDYIRFQHSILSQYPCDKDWSISLNFKLFESIDSTYNKSFCAFSNGGDPGMKTTNSFGFYNLGGEPSKGRLSGFWWNKKYSYTKQNEFANNKWYNLSYVYKSTTNELIVYIDGKDNTGVTTIINTDGSDINLGNWYVGGLVSYDNSYFKGSIDDIRIYNRALSSTEIDSLYHQGGWPLKHGLDSGLVAYFPLNGDIKDYSNSSNNGISTSEKFTIDRFGKQNNAFELDGTNPISCLDNNLPNSNKSRTFAGWIYCTSDALSLVSYGSTSFNNHQHLAYNKTVGIRYGGWNNDIDYSNINPQEKWNFIVSTFDGTNASIYINSKKVATENKSDWNTILNGNLSLGISNSIGLIDDIRIYNRLLTQTEIDSLYHQGGWPLTVQQPNYFVTESHNLDDNSVPQGWTLTEELATSNISNGKLNAFATDAYGNIERKGIVPTNTETIVCEWDGNVNYSQWNMSTYVRIYFTDTLYYHFASGYVSFNGKKQYYQISRNTNATELIKNLLPTNYGDYHYKVSINNNNIHFVANRISNSTILFDTTYKTPTEINIHDINKIRFGVGATTDNNSWLDNPTITILDSSLIAYYPFNGNANDESGNKNNGIIKGATPTADRFGNANKAYSFNGTSNYIEISSLSSLSPKPITYSVWISQREYINITEGWKGMTIMGRELSGNLADGSLQIFSNTIINQDNEIEYYTGATEFRSYYKPKLNEWIHIAYTIDNQDTARLYINGIIANSGYFTALTDLFIPFKIGCRDNAIGGNEFFFSGKIDDIRIYNRALTKVEIDSLYHQGGWPLVAPITNVTSVKILDGSQSLQLGQSYTFHTQVLPANATYQKVDWSTKPQQQATQADKLAMGINANYLFVPTVAGSYYLYATSSENSLIYDSVKVTVTSYIPVTEVLANTTNSIKVTVGKTDNSAAVLVLPATASNKSVTWSSDNKAICIVDATGTIAGLVEGTTTVRATSVDNPKLSASFTIEVIAAPVIKTSLKAQIANATLIGNTTLASELGTAVGQYSPQLMTSLQNETATAVALYISNTATQAQIDAETTKLMQAIAAFKNSQVQAVLATAVTLNSTDVQLNIQSQPYQLTAVVTPANTSNKTLDWHSSNTAIALVDEHGLVTALASGTVSISATTTDNSALTATCTVVVSIPVTSINMQENIGLTVGKSAPVYAIALPSNASNQTLVWTSSDTNIAVVNQFGIVLGKSIGSAKIKAQNNDGTISAVCVANISASSVLMTSITLPDTITMVLGQSLKIAVQVAPFNATNRTIFWQSTNIASLGLDYMGFATALSVDTITIFAFNESMSIVDSSIVIVSASAAPEVLPVTEVTVPVGTQTIKIALSDVITDDKTNIKNLVVQPIVDANYAVTIVNDTIVIKPINAQVASSSTIQILVIDQDNQSATVAIPVNVSSKANLAPVVSAIPEQTILFGNSFSPLLLPYYVKDDFTRQVLINWTVKPNAKWKTSVQFNTLFVVPVDGSWIGTDSLLVYATDEGGLKDSVYVRYNILNKPNEAPVIAQIPMQEQTDKTPFRPIELSKFVTDDYTQSQNIIWKVSSNSTKLEITLKNGKAFISVIDKNWLGGEIITFKATDQDGLSTSVDVMFNQKAAISKKTWTGKPEVSFIAERTKVGVYQNVIFHSSITGDADSYQWTFPGSTTPESFDLNPIVKYSKAGIYDVTLDAANGSLINTSSIKNYINIVGITSADTVICKNNSLKLTYSDNAMTKYVWSTGEKTSSINVSPKVDTKYYVTAQMNLFKYIDTILVNVSKPVWLGNDTAICQGKSYTFSLSGFSSYKWNNTTSLSSNSFTAKSAQNVIVETIDAFNCTSKDTANISINALPTVNLGANDSICPATVRDLDAGSGLSYSWNDGTTNQKLKVTKTGIYSVTVTDAKGCKNADTVSYVVKQPFAETLGVATVLGTHKIVAAWNRTKGKNTASYSIMREDSAANKYVLVATKLFNDTSYVVDNNVNPLEQGYRYKMVTTDACGDTISSKAHKTMLLQVSYSESNKANNLIWSGYEGVSLASYTIYRNGVNCKTMPASSSNNMYQFNDTDGKRGDKYYVSYDLPESIVTDKLKADSGPFSTSLSNLAESELTDISIQALEDVTILPNPTNGVVTITVPSQENLQITILDVLGKTVVTKSGNGSFQIDCSGFGSGVYLVKIIIGDTFVTKRLVVE